MIEQLVQQQQLARGTVVVATIGPAQAVPHAVDAHDAELPAELGDPAIPLLQTRA